MTKLMTCATTHESYILVMPMFYLSHDECLEFCANASWNIDTDQRHPVISRPELEAISFMVPPQRERATAFCRLLAKIIPHNGTAECLLWPLQGRDWGLRANYHLYYRLRQSYADFRQLHQAPGHLFLSHETDDLITFVELALLFGWDFLLLLDSTDWGAFHDDELLIVHSSEPISMEVTKTALTNFSIAWHPRVS